MCDEIYAIFHKDIRDKLVKPANNLKTYKQQQQKQTNNKQAKTELTNDHDGPVLSHQDICSVFIAQTQIFYSFIFSVNYSLEIHY